MLNQPSETCLLHSKRHQSASQIFKISSILPEVTVVTGCTLPFRVLEVFPLGVLPVGPVKPLSHSGLCQYQTSGAEEMEEVGHNYHHVRMNLKRIVKDRLT